MAKQPSPLSVDDLRARIEPESLPFDSTHSLEDWQERVVGQERAIDAIKFGMGMKEHGYNIFIAGQGRSHVYRQDLHRGTGQEGTNSSRLVLCLQLQGAG